MRILNNLYLVEQIVIFFVIIAASLYLLFGIAPRDPIGLYGQRLFHSLVFYAVGLSLCPLAIRLKTISGRKLAPGRIPWSVTWSQFGSSYLAPNMLFRDLRIVHAISVMFVTYINLKHLVPFVAPTMRDAQLFNHETSLLGELAGISLQHMLAVNAAAPLALGYVAFYSFVAVFIFVMVLSQRNARALEFAAAFVLLWFIGILLVYLLPTLGPCFFKPELFSHLPFTDVTELQQRLWQHKQHLDNHSDSPAVYLISGFPSLHLAVPLLGIVYLRQTHWMLGILSALFALLTAITTLYFGWHYVVDDLGSVLLVLLTLWSVRRLRTCIPTKDAVSVF